MIELDEEFKGWDYEELADKWGIETDPVALFETDPVALLREFIMNSLEYNYDDDVEFLLPEVKEDMEEFLSSLIVQKEKHNFGSVIFIALRLVSDEDDATFAQYFCTLLPHMWT